MTKNLHNKTAKVLSNGFFFLLFNQVKRNIYTNYYGASKLCYTTFERINITKLVVCVPRGKHTKILTLSKYSRDEHSKVLYFDVEAQKRNNISIIHLQHRDEIKKNVYRKKKNFFKQKEKKYFRFKLPYSRHLQDVPLH